MLVIRPDANRNIIQSDAGGTGLIYVRVPSGSNFSGGFLALKRTALVTQAAPAVSEFTPAPGAQLDITEFLAADGLPVTFTREGGTYVFDRTIDLVGYRVLIRRESLDCGVFNGMVPLGVGMSMSLGQPSTLGFTLIGKQMDYQAVSQTLKPGSEFTFLGVDWFVSNLSSRELTRLENANTLVEYTLSCESRLANYLQPVPWVNGGNPQRIRDFSEIINSTRQAVALPAYDYVLPEKNQLSRAYEAWPGDAEAIAKLNGGTLNYDARGGISLIELVERWGNVDHTIDESELRSPLSTNYGASLETRQSASFPETQLQGQAIANLNTPGAEPNEDLLGFSRVFDFQNAELTTNLYLNEDRAVNAEVIANEVDVRQFTRRTRVRTRHTSGSRDMPAWVNPTKTVTDASISFDQSGVTSTFTDTTSIDGEPQRVITERYGFVVTGQDIEAGRVQGALWQLIERTTRTYFYGAFGYYLGYQTRGFTTTRFSRENPRTPETLTEADENFEYVRVPINEGQTLKLQQARDFYLQEGNNSIYFEDGVPLLDPSFVPDYIVMSEEEWRVANIEKTNEDDSRLVIRAGSEYFRRKERVIYSGLNTIAPYFLSSSVYTNRELEEIKEREYYVETEYATGAEGENYDSALQIQNETVQQGRPPVGNRLPNLYEESLDNAEGDRKPQLLADFYSKIYVNSDPNHTGESRGTFDPSLARTLQDAEKAAQVEWLLNNAEGNSVSFDLRYTPQIKPGQYIDLRVYGLRRYGLVLKVDHTFNDALECTANPEQHTTSVTMGLTPLDPKLEVNIELIPNRQFRVIQPYFVGRQLCGPTLFRGLNTRYS